MGQRKTKIDRARSAHTQKHKLGEGSTLRVQDRGHNVSGKLLTCVYFNKGACIQK